MYRVVWKESFVVEEKQYLLWSGGFDSTFRLCQLAREKRLVQPVYIMYETRPAKNRELLAQEKILEFLRAKGLADTILSTLFVSDKEIPRNPIIPQVFDRVHKKFPIGGQYMSLAMFSDWLPYCELCHEGYVNRQGVLGRMLDTLTVMDIDSDGNRYIVKDKSDADAYTLFGKFYFPIIHLNNLQMIDKLKEWGLDEVIQYIQFCENDTEEPCGMCVCCLGKLSVAAKEFSFSDVARKRAMIVKFLQQFDSPYCMYSILFKDLMLNNKKLDGAVMRKFYLLRYGKMVNIDRVPYICQKLIKLDSCSRKRVGVLIKKTKTIDDLFSML